MKINFEELFDEKILKRGYNYYLEDSVHEVAKNGNNYEGLVYGTEIYEVQIEIDNNGNVEDMNCDCPYAEENNCKHMVALLYYLENDGQVEKKKKIRNTDNYDKIIDKISENEIKEFVLERLYENYEFQNEFRSHFVQYFEKTPKKVYERRISQSIYQVIGRKGFIEYNENYKFYEKQSQKEKYKNLVEETLFKYSRSSFKYYKKLKELYTKEQWKTKRDNIIINYISLL